MDFTVSIVALLILSPIILMFALLVWRKMGSPVFFRQSRPGLHGKIFKLFKFRTMTNTEDMKNESLSDAKRLTPLGVFMRSTSIDELPSLFNVLMGDMSLVGPRPLLVEYLDFYTPEQIQRHSVRPGITGWAQINGRNLLTWDEKFAFDVWYVKNMSLLLDMKIMSRTIMKVFLRDGINSQTSATMEKFKGSS
jgi:lipopolysaccharide/colanic/teichoic acid biosynthesis glycosyltransferase